MPTALDLFRLDNRAAIITGGSKGLGKAMAEALASAGADVMITSRTESQVREAADDIAAKAGRKVVPFAGDVADPNDVQRMVDTAMQQFGRIDVLINNAGINRRAPIEELTLDDFSEVMRINATGPWLTCRAVGPIMKQANYGRIINISSTLGSVALAGRTPYCSSKGAVTMLTRTLAVEWAPNNITVNAICPGPFLTEMNEPIADNEDTKRNILGMTALGRWGQLHEIQGAALFLASDASSYVTGSLLFVDGGWTAR